LADTVTKESGKFLCTQNLNLEGNWRKSQPLLPSFLDPNEKNSRPHHPLLNPRTEQNRNFINLRVPNGTCVNYIIKITKVFFLNPL